MLTEKEFMIIIAALKASYENFKLDDTQMDWWYDCLKDIPFDVLQTAIKKLVMSSPYIPKISEIRQYVVSITTPFCEQLTVDEAWGQVIRAIGSYGYMRETEALNSMSPIVAEVVKGMGWQGICESENLDVVRGQFAKWYDNKQKNVQEKRIMPLEVKNKINEIQGAMSIKQILELQTKDINKE